MSDAAAPYALTLRWTNNVLILRRPRSGRLEGWATHEIVGKAVSQRPICCRPFETRPYGLLLRVRFPCKFNAYDPAAPSDAQGIRI